MGGLKLPKKIGQGKNVTLGGMGGQKLSKIIGHLLWMIPNQDFFSESVKWQRRLTNNLKRIVLNF